MCQAGGFDLTKFISNKKDVIQSVQECDRRNGVQNADLGTILSLGKALGVYWNRETNIFRFKIVLKDKPVTVQRVTISVAILTDFKLLPYLTAYKTIKKF